MASRDHYRNKAKACFEAESMRDPMERLAMLQVAQSYLKLANCPAAGHEHGTRRPAHDPPHSEKRELERFCSALRSIPACPDERAS
jgi:hypothetical protein